MYIPAHYVCVYGVIHWNYKTIMANPPIHRYAQELYSKMKKMFVANNWTFIFIKQVYFVNFHLLVRKWVVNERNKLSIFKSPFLCYILGLLMLSITIIKHRIEIYGILLCVCYVWCVCVDVCVSVCACVSNLCIIIDDNYMINKDT